MFQDIFKKLIVGSEIFFLLTASAAAETIYLKNGQVVEGEIIEKKPFYIMVQVGGVPYKYYKQQIDRIEEKEKVSAIPSQNMSLENLQVEGISEEKIKLILELMEVMGMKATMQKNFQNLLTQAPAEKKLELEKLLDMSAIFKKIIPVYDKYYSQTDLKELINFYRSSLGIKVLEVSPKVFKESAEATIEYFKENNTLPSAP